MPAFEAVAALLGALASVEADARADALVAASPYFNHGVAGGDGTRAWALGPALRRRTLQLVTTIQAKVMAYAERLDRSNGGGGGGGGSGKVRGFGGPGRPLVRREPSLMEDNLDDVDDFGGGGDIVNTLGYNSGADNFLSDDDDDSGDDDEGGGGRGGRRGGAHPAAKRARGGDGGGGGREGWSERLGSSKPLSSQVSVWLANPGVRATHECAQALLRGLALASFPERRMASAWLGHRVTGGAEDLLAHRDEDYDDGGGGSGGGGGWGGGRGGQLWGLAARVSGGGSAPFARYATTERLDWLRAAAACLGSRLWLMHACARRAGSPSAGPRGGSGGGDGGGGGHDMASPSSAPPRGRGGASGAGGAGGNGGAALGPEGDPDGDGFGWALAAIELALVGGTSGPPAGSGSAVAFTLLGDLAQASARFDLAKARGEPAGGGSGGHGGHGGVGGGSGSARLRSRELERVLALIFPGGDEDDDSCGAPEGGGEGGNGGDGGDENVAVTPAHARKLRLWLGLHRSARRRQLGAARRLFYFYGGPHVTASGQASMAAGQAAPHDVNHGVRRELARLSAVGKNLNRWFTSMVSGHCLRAAFRPWPTQLFRWAACVVPPHTCFC